MKAISANDLQLIPELSGMTIFDLINIENDKIVYKYLDVLGFDMDYPIHYTVSQHRTLQNKVIVGYVLRGEVNVNRAHLNGPWSTITDKLVAADYRDTSLCKELLAHMSTSLSYDAFHTGKDYETFSQEKFPECLTNPDEDQLVTQIKQLEELLLAIRGNPYAKDGNLKMPKDYEEGEEEPPHVQRKKRRKKAKQA